MYKYFVLGLGALAFFVAFVATGFELVGFVVCLLAVLCFIGSSRTGTGTEDRSEVNGWLVASCAFAGIGIGIMSMDGSWFLLSVNMVVGSFFSVCSIFMLRVWQKDGTREYFLLGLSAALPILGLGLTQYLIETNRNIWSGLFAISVLIFVAWLIAPNQVVRQPTGSHLRVVSD